MPTRETFSEPVLETAPLNVLDELYLNLDREDEPRSMHLEERSRRDRAGAPRCRQHDGTGLRPVEQEGLRGERVQRAGVEEALSARAVLVSEHR